MGHKSASAGAGQGETPVLAERPDAIPESESLITLWPLQVNTHPPATLVVHLIVIVPTLTTVDDQVSKKSLYCQ